MRVMLDTNILLSALLFPSEGMNDFMRCIFEEHRLVLCSFVVDGLHSVVRRKFPTKTHAIDKFLSATGYELVYTPKEIRQGLFTIRDTKDYPVLYTAIAEDVDILVTGDKDFDGVDIDHPEIMTPSEFIKRFA